MIRPNRLSCFALLLFLAMLLSWFPATLNADVIGVVVTGPGGVPPASSVFGGTLAEPSLTYTNVAPFDVAITVDSAATYNVSETPPNAGVHNSTGVAWSGFTWSLISGPSAQLIYSPNSAPFSGLDFSNPVVFPSVAGTSTFATFSGGTLADGGNFEPAFSFIASQAGTYTIEETPLVPEPSSFALAALGLAALAAWRWRRKR